MVQDLAVGSDAPRTQPPDDANDRIDEVGWAKPFPTSGELTRTISWQVGSPESTAEVITEEPGR